MNRWMPRLFAALLAALAACGGKAPDSRLDRASIERNLNVLAVDIGPRAFDSQGSRRAAGHIAAELERLGLTVERLPVGHIVHPPLRVLGRRVYRQHHVDVRDPNLLVRFAPADPSRADRPAILLMAHYDSMATTPGAVDNAAAVALLIDLARILAAAPPPQPVLLAWTAAEEMRLSGAVKLAEALGDRVGLAISLDLIGASDVVTLNGLSAVLGRAWMARLADAARASGADVRAPAIYRVVSRLLPETERSDHGPFTARGVPAFHIYSRGAGRIYLPYHSPLDVPAEVSWEGVLASGSFALALIDDPRPLPPPGGDPGWWVGLPGGPRALPTWVLQAVELLLAFVALAGIAAMVRRWHRTHRAGSDLHLAGPAARAPDAAAVAEPSPRSRDAAAVREPSPRSRGEGRVGGLLRRHLHGRGLLGFTTVYALAWLAAWAVFALDRAATDHPAPWLHAPGTTYLTLAAVAAGVAAPCVWLIARLSDPTRRAGADRFLAAAIVLLLLSSLVPLAADAPELNQRPLAAAGLLGAAALFTRTWLCLPLAAAGLLPLAAAFDPALAREGYFHEFLAPQFPVALAEAAVLLPATLAAVWAWHRWGPALPRRGRAALGLAGVPPAVAIGLAALLVRDPPPCTGQRFARSGLYCEIEAAARPFTDRRPTE